jgi:hypothetical protein
MGEVDYTVQDGSMWQLHLDVTGAPDTSHPEHPGAALRPAGISMGIGMTDGVWSVSAVNVFGQKVKDGKVVTKRNYPLPFLDPLGADSEAPEWLRERCQEWVDRANGVGGGVRLTDQQVYDMSMRTKSSVGLENFRNVLEDVLGAEPVPSREEKPKDYARQAFDTALHGLLIRENLEGAKWAIQQILDEAKGLEGGPGLGDSAVAEYPRTLAEKISGGLDKRTAELAAENWG